MTLASPLLHISLVSCGKAIKSNVVLNLPTDDIHAVVWGKGGNPTSGQCSECHKHDKTFKYSTLTGLSGFSETCKAWLMSRPTYSETDMFCVNCCAKLLTEFVNKVAPSRRVKRT
jgi:hypothetical protein